MKAKFKISPRILEHLGVAAYTSLPKCLAELCSNCYDAEAENIWITNPETVSENSKIIIKDDGLGMSPDDIRDKYLLIGYDRRPNGEATKNKKRAIIGNKGIGKLAGFGIANTVEIISVNDHIESRLVLNKSLFDNYSILADCSLNITTKITLLPNGTEIILSNLSKQLKPISSMKLRQHLFRVLPNLPDFSVKVNDVQCSVEEAPGEKIPFEHEFEGIGKISGFYVVANVRQPQPGIVIRVRKRAVTEPRLFGLEKRSHFSFSADKLLGEVNADFLDPFINTSRDDFLAEIEEVQTLEIYLRDFFTDVVEAIEKDAEGKRTNHIIEVTDVQEKLAKLPPHIRTKARKVIEGVISKLKSASDDEVNELIDWIIKYFESNVLRELMNSIKNADSSDVERLSELIKDWGLRQINSVTEIIKNQIDIIKKLEELIDSETALEFEVHKLIEGNLWLVREGLELWSSDKPLQMILEKEFDKLYSENKLERPDLVCRSRNYGFEAVVMEFKKPSVKIKMEHITQALSYKGILQTHRPNIVFDTYVVGRKYNPDVLATKNDLEKAGLFLWSFSEILQRSRARFEKILEILDS
jgi:hypothetical protein